MYSFSNFLKFSSQKYEGKETILQLFLGIWMKPKSLQSLGIMYYFYFAPYKTATKVDKIKTAIV
jgi:hypothetical protein